METYAWEETWAPSPDFNMRRQTPFLVVLQILFQTAGAVLWLKNEKK